jgi:hypothetical protein
MQGARVTPFPTGAGSYRFRRGALRTVRQAVEHEREILMRDLGSHTLSPTTSRRPVGADLAMVVPQVNAAGAGMLGSQRARQDE